MKPGMYFIGLSSFPINEPTAASIVSGLDRKGASERDMTFGWRIPGVKRRKMLAKSAA
jgi:hypothetical protein